MTLTNLTCERFLYLQKKVSNAKKSPFKFKKSNDKMKLKKDFKGDFNLKFPKDFVFGVSTAAYQIEGASLVDGAGLCNWDVFCRKKGKVASGYTGDDGCDHYYHWQEDVELLKELGVGAYRFSINWARLIPQGIGEVNENGVQFYNSIIDKCLEYGITPYITLFHFDYPQSLENMGGWKNPDSPYWMEYYADTVGKYFGDRVKNFITINEPQCFLPLGYESGYFPPGIKDSGDYELIPMAHHMLMGHGLSVRALHKYGCKVGYAPCGDVAIPYTESEKDIEAARKCYFNCDADGWYHTISWWSDPVIFGRYPDIPQLVKYLPKGWEEDLKTISEPIDFYCQNIYGGTYYEYDSKGEKGYMAHRKLTGLTANKAAVVPEALYWGPKFLYERYKKPIFITENGMSGTDWVQLDGKVHDPQRCDYIERYLGKLSKAIEDGIDVRGYMHWSFMDNFEWASAMRERFGLVYVDYETKKRIPKDSFYTYKNIIKG